MGIGRTALSTALVKRFYRLMEQTLNIEGSTSSGRERVKDSTNGRMAQPTRATGRTT